MHADQFVTGRVRKRILFLSGTRADFGKLKALIHEVDASQDFEAWIFATGMHMLSRYGSTVTEIENAGFKQIFPYINQDATVNSQMDIVLANTVLGLGHYVREFRPDLMVIHGDRIEALAGAIVGAFNNILVAHIEGGEISGALDETIRHSISKLSHRHFVSNEKARSRLLQMGETTGSIYVIGSPDIDIMLSTALPSLDEVRARYDIDFARYAIFVYHPVTTELTELRRRIGAVIDALRASDWNYVVLFPNNDNGVDTIMSALGALYNDKRYRVIPSMRFEYFLTLLKHARAIVGNSSAGIREAPVYGVPTLNIGTRQLNRACSAGIVNVPEDREAILEALHSLPAASSTTMQFGTGESARKFIACLRDEAFWANPGPKQFNDLAGSVDIMPG